MHALALRACIPYIHIYATYELARCCSLVMITHLWEVNTKDLIIMALLSRSSAPYTASCAQGNERPGTRGYSRSQRGSGCTS